MKDSALAFQAPDRQHLRLTLDPDKTHAPARNGAGGRPTGRRSVGTNPSVTDHDRSAGSMSPSAADRRTGSAGSMSRRIGRPAGAHQIPGGGSSREYSKKNDVLALSRVGLISFRGGLIRGSSCARRPKLSAKRICRIYVLTDLIDGICQIAACRALDLGLSCLPGTSAACLARSPCKRPLRGQAPDRHAPASDSVDAIDPHMH